MIPIRDTLVSTNRPVVTWAIIGLNSVVFLIQSGMGHGLDQFVYLYGLVPAKFTVGEISRWFSLQDLVFSLISYMFLHGGLWHFLGNMWFLYIFGDNVEDHLGSFRFFGFYILSGILSGLFHLALNPYSNVPTIGASGAIAGVMGAYFILFPRSKILTLIPIIIIPWFIEIPAFLFLGFWFAMQFFNAAGSGGASGIAWWAHVGGFVSGLVLVKLLSRIPATGAADQLRKVTVKTATPKLQVIRVTPVADSQDLEGELQISPQEAVTGARKLVNIPWGFYKRLYRVTVPPGVGQGTRLRLAGLGKETPGIPRGNLYLNIEIKDAF